jgi:S-DNA-T family DNA segregation ATPase FtsK/SpoIIIE
VALVGLALLLLLSLISYDPYDVGTTAATARQPVGNYIGPVGAWIALFAYFGFGVGAWMVMLVLMGLGVILLLGRDASWPAKLGAGALLVLSSCCLLHVAGLQGAIQKLQLPDSAGGLLGLWVGDFFQQLLGTVGTFIVFLGAYLISLILLVHLRPSYWVAVSADALKDFWQRTQAVLRRGGVREQLRSQERDLRVKEYQVGRELAGREREARRLAAGLATAEREPRPEPRIEDRTLPLAAAKTVEDAAAAAPERSTVAAKLATPAVETASARQPNAAGLDAAAPAPVAEKRAGRLAGKPASPAAGAAKADEDALERSVLPYLVPPVDLLEPPPAVGQRNVIEDLKANAEMLKATLEDFGIAVELGDVTKGPTITRYEVYPAPGVKVEKIASLSNNIALAMKAVNVRILTPVPGKGTVGIEVPNSTTTTVYLRDILESEAWRKTRAKIPICLGRDVAGNAIIADLAEMPHLLIAGATGSGKTVCVNAILLGFLCRFRPEELRLVLIDPKVVEMQHYNVLPHLIVPVVTESKKTPLALRWVINEMEKRFQMFAKVGVRNITAFNARPKPKSKPLQAGAGQEGAETEPAEPELKIEVPRDEELTIPDKLPYIVVVIDELADLMLVAPADVEMAIARLAQLSRAVGIHMILATQRPSVDVVTGVIKANFPARIAFQVASKQDSRVILDANGADKLLGKGDMLYLPPGSSKLIRAQGVLVLDEEIKRILDFIGERSTPQFEAEIHQKLQKSTVLPADLAEEEDEELVEQALEVIRQTNRASVSVLQRRLRIGYTRAARIMDLLEERGYVGPNKGAEPRDILIDLDSKVPAEQ